MAARDLARSSPSILLSIFIAVIIRMSDADMAIIPRPALAALAPASLLTAISSMKLPNMVTKAPMFDSSLVVLNSAISLRALTKIFKASTIAKTAIAFHFPSLLHAAATIANPSMAPAIIPSVLPRLFISIPSKFCKTPTRIFKATEIESNVSEPLTKPFLAVLSRSAIATNAAPKTMTTSTLSQILVSSSPSKAFKAPTRIRTPVANAKKATLPLLTPPILFMAPITADKPSKVTPRTAIAPIADHILPWSRIVNSAIEAASTPIARAILSMLWALILKLKAFRALPILPITPVIAPPKSMNSLKGPLRDLSALAILVVVRTRLPPSKIVKISPQPTLSLIFLPISPKKLRTLFFTSSSVTPIPARG